MVESVFAEQTLVACVIESDQSGDHCFRRSGLRISDGLLERNAACAGIKGNVRQPMLFDSAPPAADAAIPSGSFKRRSTPMPSIVISFAATVTSTGDWRR